MNQAAAILNHYFAALARQSGMRWTAANRAEIEHAVELMEAGQLDEVPTLASLTAAAHVEDAPQPGRETVSFERPAPASRDQFRQAADMADAQRVHRMVAHNGRERQ